VSHLHFKPEHDKQYLKNSSCDTPQSIYSILAMATKYASYEF